MKKTLSLPKTDKLAVEKSTAIENNLGVIAKQDFKKGEVIFLVKGPIKPKPTKYSLSLDLDKHIDPLREDGSFDFGHYLNHSCNPNTIVHIVGKNTKSPHIEVIARHDIKAGEELAFDYASLEYDVTIANSVCKCGSLICRGKIHGFKDLPEDFIEKYKKEGMIPDYLLKMKDTKVN